MWKTVLKKLCGQISASISFHVHSYKHLIPLIHNRWVNPWLQAWDKMPQSFNYRLMSLSKLVIQWPTIPFLERAIDVLKCLKFLPKSFHTVTEGDMHGLYQVVTQSCFGSMCPSDSYQR